MDEKAREANRASMVLGVIALVIAYRTDVLRVVLPITIPATSYFELWPTALIVDFLAFSLTIYAICMFVYFSDDLDKHLSAWSRIRNASRTLGLALFAAALASVGITLFAFLLLLALQAAALSPIYLIAEFAVTIALILLVASDRLRSSLERALSKEHDS